MPPQVEWRDRHQDRLPHYGDFLRGTPHSLWCTVVGLSPPLRLPWKYTPQQALMNKVWECGAVWVHCQGRPNGEEYTAGVFADLEQAVDTIARNKGLAQYSLLVKEGGMEYDPHRLGGDLGITTGSGRHFTFSVRKGMRNSKVLLAIAHN